MRTVASRLRRQLHNFVLPSVGVVKVLATTFFIGQFDPYPKLRADWIIGGKILRALDVQGLWILLSHNRANMNFPMQS